jgi:hypothetical protein
MGPGAAEVIEDPPVRVPLHSPLREGRSQSIPAQALQPRAIRSDDGLRRVQAETRDTGAERLRLHIPASLEADLRHRRADRRRERLLQRRQCGIRRPPRCVLFPLQIHNDPAHPARDLQHEFLHLLCRRRGERREGQATRLLPSHHGENEEAVGQDAVEMRAVERVWATLETDTGARSTPPRWCDTDAGGALFDALVCIGRLAEL